ncbi:hypothetical protein KDK_29560 [Dictyobacter kobayashii]|uniref:Uncharacterized protein n=1 Tax=Dictyobacter kobayashii TaxID=2014872 RepID=A0A402AJ85_9CHLR|nr:hypothetical protein [Dictyobacter kobayashii]GCE19156.1 hypothetical protein KDK_29560 [Dictyobacter kobayashii]
MDEQTNPLEARLGWTVKLNKGAAFIGSEALQQVKEQGPARLLVGVQLLERGVPRGGYALYAGEQQIGSLTSGARDLPSKKTLGWDMSKRPTQLLEPLFLWRSAANVFLLRLWRYPFISENKGIHRSDENTQH